METTSSATDDATDELTESGIFSDHPDVTLAETIENLGEPVHESEDTLVFADRHGLETNEWPAVLGVDTEEFVGAMHEIAGRFEPNDGIGHWGAHDPVAFDTRTFADK